MGPGKDGREATEGLARIFYLGERKRGVETPARVAHTLLLTYAPRPSFPSSLCPRKAAAKLTNQNPR